MKALHVQAYCVTFPKPRVAARFNSEGIGFVLAGALVIGKQTGLSRSTATDNFKFLFIANLS